VNLSPTGLRLSRYIPKRAQEFMCKSCPKSRSIWMEEEVAGFSCQRIRLETLWMCDDSRMRGNRLIC
jgi:hypothetical protein